ncbi:MULTISPECIES: hypothetical protein [unclassified Bradyrhizobium]|uniref:hypothetical protein n=1 Tax=unclassified Bradyrhizobium TaxID=2631580 RepID=UPI001FF8A022|nr:MULTISPECIES: hypothetical protein [unclassified Bradyrhizobium]MCK1714212.1 hypothetical protein [Bradyrhizobium sp. 143]MCK1725614.1 hypothetical protein [Bradyrhizobium sp. 142]
MNFTIVPRGRKPKPPIPLHRYMYRACRDIEHITRTALTCPPTGSWSQYLLTNIVRAMRNGADELERAIELRNTEDRALHQERLARLRQREAESKGGNHA